LLASFEARERSGCHLDYSRLVRPEVVAATYQEYVHAEDFFFRSVHLGTCLSLAPTLPPSSPPFVFSLVFEGRERSGCHLNYSRLVWPEVWRPPIGSMCTPKMHFGGRCIEVRCYPSPPPSLLSLFLMSYRCVTCLTFRAFPPSLPRHGLLGLHRHSATGECPSVGGTWGVVHGQCEGEASGAHSVLFGGTCDDAHQYGLAGLLGAEGMLSLPPSLPPSLSPFLPLSGLCYLNM